MDGKVSGSSSHGQTQAGRDRQRAWSQLTMAYLHDLLRQLDEISAFLAAEDYIAIKRYAHRNRGTSGTYHLDSIAKMFTRLEQLAREGDPGGIAATVRKIRSLAEVEIQERSRLEGVPPDTSERNTHG
jgi:HPt (histidine-containing phosphotransfer) domain-containing protein